MIRILAIISLLFFPSASATMEQPLVRMAELEIDPSQLAAYRYALKEEISTSIRVEPGVRTLYAVAVKGHPEQIRIFETYADQAATKRMFKLPISRNTKPRPKEW